MLFMLFLLLTLCTIVVVQYFVFPYLFMPLKKCPVNISNRLTFFPFFLVLFSALLLSGCWTRPQPVIIEKVRIVKQSIPEVHLLDCIPPALLDRKKFMAMEMYEREEQLTLYSLGTLATLSLCNKQIQQIRELNNDHQQKDQ